MAFACQALIAGRQKENQFVSIREHSWTTICFLIQSISGRLPVCRMNQKFVLAGWGAFL
jgi:hypothetical protein